MSKFASLLETVVPFP